MASRLVNIVKAFTLSIVRDGQVVVERIEAGVQRLEQDVADHWYTKAHAADVPKGVKQSDAEAAAEAVADQDAVNADVAAAADAAEAAPAAPAANGKK